MGEGGGVEEMEEEETFTWEEHGRWEILEKLMSKIEITPKYILIIKISWHSGGLSSAWMR